MPKPIDFQDSIMFGDEAAIIPVAKSQPRLCHVLPPAFSRMDKLSMVWADIVYAVRFGLQKLSSMRRPTQAFGAVSYLSLAKPVEADPLAYDSFGLPKPE